jgi:predicted nucleic acid-binding protein
MMAVAVIDTNVVLDWLVFRDPSVRALVEAIDRGSMRWIATDAMRNELQHVMQRHQGSEKWSFDPGQAIEAWQRWAHVVPAPPPSPRARRLRCTDPDDQKFIDLAVAQPGGCWVFSRDRAVLKLARAAKPFGVQVLTAARWAEAQAPGGTPPSR